MDEGRIKELRQKAIKLPELPGVYLMRDKSGKIIYIGKAKALKNRVSQYFSSPARHDEKVRHMVENVHDFEYIITDSEFEALVLECSLIKQHRPKYNILLKDDKGYHYIRVSPPPWRTIKEAKKIEDDGAEYIGPYTSSWAVKQAVESARKIFRLPGCSRRFPEDIGKGRPCLNSHIGQCMAPCSGKVSLERYEEAVEDALEFLKGGSAESIKALTKQMEEAAERLEFERAAALRDRIAAIKRIAEKQKVVANAVKEQDVIALARLGDSACFEVFRFKGGSLYDREEFLLKDIGAEKAARTEFLHRYYHIRDFVPVQITLDGPVEDASLTAQWLSEKAGRKVKIVVPQKGEQAKLVEMCRSNAAERLAQSVGRTLREAGALDELGRLLGLNEPPRYIEAYDISNTAGSDNVGAMVVFEDGRPKKSAYRKFIIKDVEGQDDYASMQEVITRRLERYLEEKDSGEGFGKLPDLILLDGGRGHVSSVLPVVRRHGFDIPVFGMVKDERHRTRAVAADGGEISIASTRRAFTLLSQIQEEVHRFAIGFHRQRRKKRVLGSSLLQIEGVGEKRAKALLKHFGTIERIKGATLEELAAVPGMNISAAENLRRHFDGR